jgi:hypothetical protein
VRKQFIDALVEMARDTDPGGIALPSATERRAQFDAQTTLTAFRNLVDGRLSCSLSTPLSTLDEEESAALQEGLLRLTAETRFGDPRHGSLDPEAGASLTVDVPRELLDEPDRLEQILESLHETLEALHVPAHEASLEAPSVREAQWIPV